MVRDLKAYARQTDRRLILGGILVLLLVGVGLIDIFYGRNPALFGLFCMIIGLAPLLLVWLALLSIGWLAKRLNQISEGDRDDG